MKPNQFKLLQKRYTALLVTQILFAIVALVIGLIIKKTVSNDVQLDRALQLVTVLMALVFSFIGFRLYNKKVLELRAGSLPAQKKMDAFKNASVKFWTLLAVPAMVCVMCYIITGNFAFIGLFALLLFILGSQNPFKSKVALLLKLSSNDVALLDGSAL